MFSFNDFLQLCSKQNPAWCPACIHSVPSVLGASVFICKCWLKHAYAPSNPPTPTPPLHYFWWLVSWSGGRICSLAQKYWSRVVKFICRRPSFPSEPWHVIDHKWSARQTWGKMIVSDPAGIFMSSAYKADFGYYGKSSKNSWNWRYAAWLLRVSLVFQRSEIFLNFATQPSLLPITSPCPPAQIQTPDLLHPVTVCREQQGESNAARGTRTHGSSSRELSWGMKMFEIWDQRCMIPRLGMWPPRAQQFILRHASGFWSPATFFLSHFQSVSALRPGSDIHPGLLCTLFFPPLPLGSVVNLKMRLREQILKHRSAFHTLFRKNSPSEGEMSLCFHPYFQPLRFFFSSFFFLPKHESYSLLGWTDGAAWIYISLGSLQALILVPVPPRGGWTGT